MLWYSTLLKSNKQLRKKLKNIKKVVDRLGKICYYNQAACEKENKKRELAAAKKQQTEPWKLKTEQYTNPENSKSKAGFGLGFEKNSEQNQSNEGLK